MSAEIAGTYADGTVGWSGSDTSREAGENTARIGRRQSEILAAMVKAGPEGMTCREVEDTLGIGHGSASGALTRLHRDGKLVRIKERRNRQEVYILPVHLGSREQSPYRPNRAYREESKPMPLDKSITKPEVIRAMVDAEIGLLYADQVMQVLATLGVQVESR